MIFICYLENIDLVHFHFFFSKQTTSNKISNVP